MNANPSIIIQLEQTEVEACKRLAKRRIDPETGASYNINIDLLNNQALQNRLVTHLKMARKSSVKDSESGKTTWPILKSISKKDSRFYQWREEASRTRRSRLATWSNSTSMWLLQRSEYELLN